MSTLASTKLSQQSTTKTPTVGSYSSIDEVIASMSLDQDMTERTRRFLADIKTNWYVEWCILEEKLINEEALARKQWKMARRYKGTYTIGFWREHVQYVTNMGFRSKSSPDPQPGESSGNRDVASKDKKTISKNTMSSKEGTIKADKMSKHGYSKHPKGDKTLSGILEDHQTKGYNFPEQKTDYYATPDNYIQMTQEKHGARHKSYHDKQHDKHHKNS
ncbi:hypothetical protein H4219_004544 [Mycoemilia scoparia]|uniref:Uncharacterized protein n=1 Tax=Mycoemilia scoparia TaxID=417184 RepID=A0A9W7ZVX2_9FUNG|nr:hypothetical protein H4219_004544 [Mycoemilia scoparia]